MAGDISCSVGVQQNNVHINLPYIQMHVTIFTKHPMSLLKVE